jgi:vacuolar-type H+-ATPase catalytic subunit A/Vma1
MKNMMAFHDEAQKAVSQGHAWPKVRDATSEIQSQLRSMKFELPSDGQEKVTKKVSSVNCCYRINANVQTVRRTSTEDDRQVCIGCRRVNVCA